MQKFKLIVLLLLIVSEAVFAQVKTVTGTIKDNTGTPLPGVTIMVTGTATGILSGIDGTFSIQARPNDVLRISFIGYVTQEVVVGNQTVINIVLPEDVVSLEEVVVVGYGQQKKQSVVGAISTAKGTDLLKTGGLTNLSSALTGMVSGVVTMNSVGKPGRDQADILIRGKSTWNNAYPLVLVDGIERDFNAIDINEVESMSVLKDASATAVFGVRGANGVILISTKRGKTGVPTFRVGANANMKFISKMPTYANAYESRWMRNEVIEVQVPVTETSWGYYTPYEVLMHYKDQDLPYLFPDVNWREETVKNLAWSERYNLEVSGGTDFVKYFASVSYMKDGDIIRIQDFGQGYLPLNNYIRVNFRTNLDFQPTKTTTFSIDIDGSQGRDNHFNADETTTWDGMYGKAPDMYPVRYEDGIFGWSPSVDQRQLNTVYAFNLSGYNSDTKNDYTTTFRFDQKLDFITKGLSFRALGSYQGVYTTSGPQISGSQQETKYIDPYTGIVEINYPNTYTQARHGFNYVPLISTSTAESIGGAGNRNILYQASLNYNRSFGKSTIGGLMNFRREQRTAGSSFTYFREEWAGRVTYDYDNRYLFETNIGYNGSEQFGPNYKFGFFPSFAIGWNLGSEDFIKDKLSFLNKLKLRYSTGKVGNDNAGGARWLYLSSWQYSIKPSFGEQYAATSIYNAVMQSNIGNPNLRWETSTKNDMALETAFFKNLITLNVDYFWSHRKDIFMSADQRHVIPWFGADPVAGNIGETKDHGWEFEGGFNKITSKKLRYYANVSYSYVKDEIVYKEDPELTPAYMKDEGFPINQQRTTLYSGIIDSWDEMYNGSMAQTNITSLPGDYRFIDYNADGYIDSKDVVPYGYSDHPQIISNYMLGVEYKGFSVMVQFYSTRNSIANQDLVIWGGDFMNRTIDRIALDNGWIPGREGAATFRRPNWNYTIPGNGQYNKVDGTLWRLKTSEIAYTFTSEFLKKMAVNSARLYVNGNNLWLWSHLNEDREIISTRGKGFEYYPLTKRVNFGIDITF